MTRSKTDVLAVVIVVAFVVACVWFGWWSRSRLLDIGDRRTEECVELGGVPQRYGQYGQYVNCLKFVGGEP